MNGLQAYASYLAVRNHFKSDYDLKRENEPAGGDQNDNGGPLGTPTG